ncbi:MAG: hypothetical protein JWQ48_2529 [Conexibacter sp.]|nr:hypothetical protein [Conexibacter sp.]
MLDPRIYRAAFLPILFALVLVGFSLRDQPRPLATTLAPQAFDGAQAFQQLNALAAASPDRQPGSSGDGRVAQTVAGVLAANHFRVGVRRFDGETALGTRALQTVIGERIGFSSRRILVVAHRDALGRGARAELSGTAALLELARVLGGRTLGRTLVLASTSGGSGGDAGALQLARQLGGPVDAVLVLGDVAGTETVRPVVVPWSGSQSIAPLELRRTVESAVRSEAGVRPGGDRMGVQFTRLALPLTLGEQGPFDARGIPAVLLSASGERPPAASQPVSEARIDAFGRAALRSISALDGGRDVPRAEPYILIQHKVLPAWPVRLLVATLILPVLLAAIDAFARVRRRRQPVVGWLGWVGACALPFVLATLVAIALPALGVLDATPPLPVPGGAIPRQGGVLVAILVVLLLGWFVVRRLLLRVAGIGGDPTGPGAAAAVVLVLCAVAIGIWIANPFAALLLVPALHLWLLAIAPEVRPRPLFTVPMFVVGLLPPLLVAFAYARQFGLDPLELAWTGTLLVAGGQVGIVAALVWSVVLGCSAAVLVIVVRGLRHGPPEERVAVTVRGPSSYAGPGSLGGTESALRR